MVNMNVNSASYTFDFQIDACIRRRNVTVEIM